MFAKTNLVDSKKSQPTPVKTDYYTVFYPSLTIVHPKIEDEVAG